MCTFETELLEDEATEGTGDGFVCFIDGLEMLFGHVVVLDGLFVWMEVAAQMDVAVFDLLVGGIF